MAPPEPKSRASAEAGQGTAASPCDGDPAGDCFSNVDQDHKACDDHAEGALATTLAAVADY